MTTNNLFISNLLSGSKNSSATTMKNQSKVDFGDLIMQMNKTSKERTIGDDIAAAIQLNINDTAALRTKIDSLMQQNQGDELNSLFTQLSSASSTSQYSSIFQTYDSSEDNNRWLNANDKYAQINVSEILQNELTTRLLRQLTSTKTNLQRQYEEVSNSKPDLQYKMAIMEKNIETVQTYLDEMQMKLKQQASTSTNSLNALNTLYSLKK